MVEFLAKPKKTKTKRPVKFKTKDGEKVSFKARRRPQRRVRVNFKTKNEKGFIERLFS